MRSNRPTDCRYPTDSGFTLMEVLFASAVLAVAVLAVCQAVAYGQMQTYEALHQMRAQALAEAMIEEVLAKPYADPGGDTTPGPDAGENARADFDAADDYHGFNEPPGAVADAAGALYAQPFQTFTRTVTAAYGPMTVTGFANPINGLTVTVTVTDTRGTSWTITRFRPEPVP